MAKRKRNRALKIPPLTVHLTAWGCTLTGKKERFIQDGLIPAESFTRDFSDFSFYSAEREFRVGFNGTKRNPKWELFVTHPQHQALVSRKFEAQKRSPSDPLAPMDQERVYDGVRSALAVICLIETDRGTESTIRYAAGVAGRELQMARHIMETGGGSDE